MLKNIFIVILCFFVLSACNEDPSAKILGAWKSKEVDFLGKPKSILFKKDAVTMAGTSVNIRYEEKNGVIFIYRLENTTNAMFTIKLKDDVAEIQSHAFNALPFYKITEEEFSSLNPK